MPPCPKCFKTVAHFHSLRDVSISHAWVTVGIFDGVHLGHRALLTRLVEGARANGCSSVVLTLHPHPAVVLGGQEDFAYLSPPEEKAALLTALGVDVVITQLFDRDFASQTAEEFMRLLVQTLGLRHLIIGYDTALGRGREGDARRLTELGQALGYTVETISAVQHGAKIISSSAIREQIRAGAVAEAAAALGRWYTVSGPVVHGDGRGRHIHLPTANILYPQEKLIPPAGIYATWAWVGEKRYAAATNIGINPTFTPQRQNIGIEAHLLDFSGDLYGQEVRLEFVQRLRGEQKFASAEALLAQIQQDIARVRELLT